MINLKTLILLTAGHLVVDINTGALPAFLPFIRESLSLSYTMTASVILIFNVTSSVIQPVFGYLSDRWSAKWLIPAGCLAASLGLSLLGLGPSYAWVFLFAAFGGAGQGSFHPEGFKAVYVLSDEKKATYISLFLVGGGLGLALGPFLATLFYKYLGLRGSLLFLPFGIVMTFIFMTSSLWKVKTPLPVHGAKDQSTTDTPAKSFFPMALIVSSSIVRSAAQTGLQTFVPFYLIDVLHRDPLIIGKYLSVFLFLGTLGGLVGGPVADRYGYKKTVLYTLVLCSPFLYLFHYTSGWESLLFFACAGFTLNVPHAITMAMGQSYMPRNLGMASGLILGFAMGAGGIGAMILGWVADHWGLKLVLQIIFVLPLLGAIIFLFIPYPPKRQ